MSTLKRTTVALALAAALPALAAEPAVDVKKELQALKDRIAELEKAKAAAPAAAGGAAGMTAEQLADFNRIAVKTEALEDGRDASGLKGFVVSGYADVNYVYNANKERGGFQFLVPIDNEAYGYDNSYMGSIALDIQKETDSGTKYRLTIVPKRSTGDVMGEYSIVHEATVNIPLSGDVRLFAGQIPDWQGYEYLLPTQNKLITHNLLFDYTLSSAYVGAGLEFSLGDIAMKAALVNVNGSVRAIGESVPALVYRGDYEVSEFLGFGFAGVHGQKANLRATVDSGFGLDADGLALLADGSSVSGKDTWVHTFEIDGWYTRGDLSLNGQVSYGQQEKASVTADPTTGELRDSQWFGASALVGYKLTPRLEGVLRADYLYSQKNGGGLLDWVEADTDNGLGPDPDDAEKGADRYAATVGFNYAYNENTTFKAEYRYDGSSKKVFARNSDGKPLSGNSLVSAGVVVFF